ncbi:MAG: hypothetical protein ACO3A2_03090 [Bdellovibrionia bacterium]
MRLKKASRPAQFLCHARFSVLSDSPSLLFWAFLATASGGVLPAFATGPASISAGSTQSLVQPPSQASSDRPAAPPVSSGVLPQAPDSGSSLNHPVLSVDPQYERCGPECYYQRANENIALQGDYIRKKMDFLLLSPDQGSKRSLLGSFCGPTEDTDDCAERYIRLNQLWYPRLRRALQKNHESINQLVCAQFSEDRTQCLRLVEGPKSITSDRSVPIEVGSPSAKWAQSSYFMKYDELRDKAGRMLSAPQQANSLDQVQDGVMAEQFGIYKPDINDFIRFKKIPKDPNDPSKGSFEVPESGPNRYDRVAYEKALAYYDKHFGSDRKKDHAPNDLTETLLSQKQGKTRQTELMKVKEDESKDPKKISVERILYNQARGEKVDAFNQYISNQNAFNSTTTTATFPGVSGTSQTPQTLQSPQATKPTPQQPKFYTGDEEMVAVPSGSLDKNSDSEVKRAYFFDVPVNRYFLNAPLKPQTATQGSSQGVVRGGSSPGFRPQTPASGASSSDEPYYNPYW